MRKFMHRIISKDSEIDPMNAPTRTVFYDRNKSNEIKKSEQSNIVKNNKKVKLVKKQSQNYPKSLEKFLDPKIADEKYEEIQKKLDIEKASHSKVKNRLQLKSKSVKKAKLNLVETQMKLDSVMKIGSEEFEENKMEIIGKLSSKMVHDIRNPLTVLQMQVELMQLRQKKHEDENVTYSLIKMEEAITNITNQINDVMNFIRKPKFQISYCDLKDLLTRTIKDLSIPKNVQVDVLLNSNMVKCDIIKMKGVLTNIIQNSIQATKSNGQITISLKEIGSNAEISISDSGAGIPEENLEKIFEPMFTTKPMGTGLGLSSSKEL
ncbi:MAG: HAMP domain-containing histidine kinase, partial [Robiginitomaculum sp.]|nr:HAMP domain-containing histidine kinase [Robiginitomaculum sp.]